MFIRIPEISTFEWHPFTISSAPEDEDQFTLHIRAAGGWTNKLHEYFKEELRLFEDGKARETGLIQKFQRYGDLHNLCKELFSSI